jgi:hypothetical protein
MELPSASAPTSARASTPPVVQSSPTINRPPPPVLGSAARSFGADSFMPAKSGGGAPAAGRAAAVAAKGNTDTQHDGRLVGPDGRTHAPGTPLNQVAPGNGPLIIQVNGINTNLAGQQAEMASLQQRNPNARVVGIHNSTEGMGRDLLQSIRDLNGAGGNAATNTLRQTILGELRAGRPVHLAGYSQGAIITSRALSGVRDTLIQEHSQQVRAANPRMSASQVRTEATRRAEAQMGNIRVETFGGAAPSYPNGPRYVHYVNRGDPVAMLVGLGPLGTGRGRGAQVHYFNDGIGIPAHGFDRYMNHRVPFDQARRGDFTRR